VHVNSTARGGGVAEILSRLVGLQCRVGIPAAWAVTTGSDAFFDLTKLLHHVLHGDGDPTPLADPAAAELYRSTLEPQAAWLSERIGPEDVVVLHDPQTVGLAPALARTGARIAWHCHVGSVPEPGSPQPKAWRFLEPYLGSLDVVLNSRKEFAPPSFPVDRHHVVHPAIDAESPKNRPLSETEVRSLLSGIGLLGGVPADGNATVEQEEPLDDTTPTVLQVSRWDPLKGMERLLGILASLPPRTHLVLAGADPREIPDDPEGLRVLDAVRRDRDALPAPLRSRVHLVTMSMKDEEHSALLVNALQRRADVIVQWSLQEGFGLTVTEAMFKERAVVASDVGGITLQIRHGHNGLLVAPDDHEGFASAIGELIAHPRLRERFGAEAARSASERFLMPRLVEDYRRHVHPALVPQETV
jgi:trehalose synthase